MADGTIMEGSASRMLPAETASQRSDPEAG